MICQVSRHFHAVYHTWGAISELTTLEAYGIFAPRSRHPMPTELLRRHNGEYLYRLGMEYHSGRGCER